MRLFAFNEQYLPWLLQVDISNKNDMHSHGFGQLVESSLVFAIPSPPPCTLSNSSTQSNTSFASYCRSLSFIASPLHPCSPTIRSALRACHRVVLSRPPHPARTCSPSFCWCLHTSPVVSLECCIDAAPLESRRHLAFGHDVVGDVLAV
jgi:hypothetical protein